MARLVPRMPGVIDFHFDCSSPYCYAASAWVDALAAWNDPVWEARLKRANDEASAAGIFGPPAA